MLPEDDRPGGRPTSGPTRRRASRAGRGAATTSIEADLERATAMLAQTSGQSRDADTGPLEAEMQRAEVMLSGIAGPSAAGPSALGQATRISMWQRSAGPASLLFLCKPSLMFAIMSDTRSRHR